MVVRIRLLYLPGPLFWIGLGAPGCLLVGPARMALVARLEDTPPSRGRLNLDLPTVLSGSVWTIAARSVDPMRAPRESNS